MIMTKAKIIYEEQSHLSARLGWGWVRVGLGRSNILKNQEKMAENAHISVLIDEFLQKNY
jgi:hypothetical protein